MSIDADDRLAFEFGKVAAWLLDRDGGHMVWRIGASEGMPVDPLRPVMVNYDPPAVLLEPDAHRFAALERGYRNNRNAMFLPFGYGTGEGRVYAVDPITVAAAGLPQTVGASPVRNGKKGINGKTSMIQGSSCIEKTAVPVVTYQDMLAKTGRAADILVVDAGGMGRAIILDILGHGASPMVLHFETRRLDADEQHALLAAVEGDYVVLRFGDAMTAYRIDVIKDYARALYIEHGMPTIYSAGLKMLNGL